MPWPQSESSLSATDVPGQVSGDAAAPPHVVVSGALRPGTDSLHLNVWAANCWIAAPVLILIISLLLTAGENRQVLLPWFGIALPETCAMYSRFGIDCPGCGLTRSFIHLAHANPASAWQLNPLSLVLFVFVVSQLPLALLHRARMRAGWINRWTRLNEWSLVALVIALAVQWLWRLISGDIV